nr:cytochrome P460 family protein [Plastoroseomonas arctica]
MAQTPYRPGPHNIVLPADWQARFIRTITVDSAARRIIRTIYVNPEAFAAARPAQPLPDGTFLIMADQRARLDADGTPLRDSVGRFIPEPGWIAIAAQQRNRGWGEGYPPTLRNGEWEYARFNGDGSRNNGPVEACFTCHLVTRAQQDFSFGFWDFVQARR